MGDGYYYTLSAIAQSFAAIIALNAIFVVYKNQILVTERDKLVKIARIWFRVYLIRNENYPELEADRYLNTLTDDDMLNHCRQCKGGYGEIVEGVKKSVKKIDENRLTSCEIFYWLKVTFLLNGSVIIASLFLLPWRNVMPGVLRIVASLAILLLSTFALAITIHAILITIEKVGIDLVGRLLTTIGIRYGSSE